MVGDVGGGERRNVIKIRFGKITKFLTPGYSWCKRCFTTWYFVNGHSTSYSETSGCFPLCEECWAECSIEERLPFYRELFEEWRGFCPEPDNKWEMIKKAVLEGK